MSLRDSKDLIELEQPRGGFKRWVRHTMSGYAPKTIGLFCKEGCKWCNIAALKWARDEHVYNNQIQDLIHALHQQRDPKALDRIMNMSLTGMPYPVKKDGSINYGDDN